MQIYLKIICLSQSLSQIKSLVALFYSHVDAKSIKSEITPQYWKSKECLVYESWFCCPPTDLDVFKLEISNISGEYRVFVNQDDCQTEVSCYTTIPEILSKQYLSFVTCYLSPK